MNIVSFLFYVLSVRSLTTVIANCDREYVYIIRVQFYCIFFSFHSRFIVFMRSTNGAAFSLSGIFLSQRHLALDLFLSLAASAVDVVFVVVFVVGPKCVCVCVRVFFSLYRE